MSELILYETARRALGEARRVDEVAAIRNKAVAMQTYAQQAKDRSLIEAATEIRLRAEIKAGELLAEMRERGERQGAGGNRWKSSSARTLADLGVTRTQSSQWQRLAALPEPEREARIEHAKKRMEAAAMPVVKASGPSKKQPPQPVDRCARTVRMAVRAFLRETPASTWPGLFTTLRRTLDDIEQAAERRRVQRNHYAMPPQPARSTESAQ